MKAMWMLIVALLCGCVESNPQQPTGENSADANDDATSGASDTLDLVPSDGVADLTPDLPLDLADEVLVDVGADLEVTAPEIVEEIEEAESSCHTDCFGGVKCADGVMLTAATGPIPCWVDPNADCFDYGDFSWPCVSGICAEHELCADDQEHLASLVPPDVTWLPGVLDLAPTDGGFGDLTCLSEGCEWVLTGADDGEVLRLVLPPLSSGTDTVLEGTTNLRASVLPIPGGALLPQVTLNGIPQDEGVATMIWAHYTIDYGHPAQGFSGALLLEQDGLGTTAIVWRVTAGFSNIVEYSVEVTPPYSD